MTVPALWTKHRPIALAISTEWRDAKRKQRAA